MYNIVADYEDACFDYHMPSSRMAMEQARLIEAEGGIAFITDPEGVLFYSTESLEFD